MYGRRQIKTMSSPANFRCLLSRDQSAKQVAAAGSGNSNSIEDLLEHSLLGMGDAELAKQLNVTLPSNGGTSIISDELHKHGCGGD